jgi:RimJ/RimL family protein N-acetyltransferase
VTQGRIQLVPLAADTLTVAEPWFHDEQTQRWLGGPGWPALVLRLASDPPAAYRGRRVTGRFAWLAYAEGQPVGLVDVERYADGTAGLALVVDPARRRQGLGKRIIQAVLAHPELGETELIRAGIEPDNQASVRCFTAVGFAAETDEPDEEGVVYFRRRVHDSRVAALDTPASPPHPSGQFDELTATDRPDHPQKS